MTERRADDRDDVVVVGSANADLVLRVAALPRPGETILARGSARACGGKGANQAIAAARAGARTAFLGTVGDDADGRLLRGTLAAAGVDVAWTRAVGAATGLAVVVVADDGENSIVVVPGANGDAAPLAEAELARVRTARVLLGQLETPAERFAQAARALRGGGAARGRVVLNAAPSGRAVDPGLWPLVDLLVVNEHEACEHGGRPEVGDAVGELLSRVPHVVVTLGPVGALVADRSGLRRILPAPAARAVDSTAAGDAFCGVLAAGLARGLDVLPAVERANVAGSLAVERHGAEPSIPTAAAVDARLAEGARDAPAGRPHA